MNRERTDGALLAGVCAGLARMFDWNVWVLRALFVGFLLIKTIWAVVAYAGLALVFHLINGEWRRQSEPCAGLKSPELAGRSQRIVELERRFDELERQ